MTDSLILRIDQGLELQLLNGGHADELYELTDKNRDYLRLWLPWLDSNKYLQNTIDYIDNCQKLYTQNLSIQLCISYKCKIAGVVGFQRIDWLNRSTSIGYWLGEFYQGNGLITKSCRNLINYGFSSLGLNRIEIRCAVENVKSQAIPNRLGFKREGTIREAEWLYDHYVDHIIYGMLKSDWDLS